MVRSEKRSLERMKTGLPFSRTPGLRFPALARKRFCRQGLQAISDIENIKTP
jgi:hypothetical protein